MEKFSFFFVSIKIQFLGQKGIVIKKKHKIVTISVCNSFPKLKAVLKKKIET